MKTPPILLQHANSERVSLFFKYFLDILILICTFTNLYLYIQQLLKTEVHITMNAMTSEEPSIISMDSFSSIEYTSKELEDAINQLHLPTWSRAYVPCTSEKSEVTCSQVVHSWRVIQQWVNYIGEIPYQNRKYIHILHCSNGLGNRIGMDVVMFLLAVMTNRSIVIEGNHLYQGKVITDHGSAYDFSYPVIHLTNETQQILSARNEFKIETLNDFHSINFFNHSNETFYLRDLLFSSMIYVHYQLSDFALRHFGMHSIYFLTNFLIKYSDDKYKYIFELYKNIPKNIRIFGIHLRFQQPGHFFTYGIDHNMRTLVPFLNDQLNKRPTIFAFTSDSKEMETEFLKVYGNNTILTNTIKKPDFDHDSPQVDVLFLMYADQCLLTFRSSFSFLVMASTCKRGYFIEKESPGIFRMANSQAGAISALYHRRDYNDWQTTRRLVLNDMNENCYRYYFNYFLI
ncbi:hypothetical protein GPJ56_007197 [Histomonas meleagridis]|uniref:uncharacterized protein n=1 Tax=Histomonas meleagridis TaxID=135588 RepID=UPI00355A9181|nr:hypothetical protein GPJ56_007197 [Histomonas meleagridis]KAH0800120.1 hypothetical protein GO595_007232 [Histomonas meleagridis]